MKDRLNPPEPHNPPEQRVRHDALVQWSKDMLDKYGFFIHFVIDGEHANIHTHGLDENFHHPDLQIALNIPQQSACGLLHAIVDQIRKGKSFETGRDYDEIATLPTRFIRAEECGRTVLRLIIPDRAGTLDREGMDPAFARQYENLKTD